MSQNDFTIANQTFPNTRADINSALQALASNSSGSSAPSTTFANQFFYDTTNNLLKIRNEDNDAFITICELDQANDTVEYFKSDSIRTALIEFTDGDDALTIADGGALTTAGNLSIGGSNNELRFFEGANFVGFEAPALTGDQIFVLPATDGTANQALVTDGSGNLSFGSAGVTRPNVQPLIINGDMQIAQRGTSATGLTSPSYPVCDRWLTDMSTAGTWTVSQSTETPTGSGFRSSTKYDCTTANSSLSAGSFMTHQQRLEGQDLQLFKKGTSSAEKFSVSFWVKSAKTGTYIVELFDNDNTRQVSQAYTISSADTWEKKVLSFPADTTGAFDNDNASSLHLFFWLLAGTNFASGTLSTSWTSSTNANRAVGQVNIADSTDNEWYITGVQLEVGEYTSSTIPSFQHESQGESLMRCKRYFNRLTKTSDFQGVMTGFASASNNCRALMYHTPEMRAIPTITKSGDFIRSHGTATALSFGVASNSTRNATIDWGASVFTAEQGVLITFKTGTAFIQADAEL